MVKQGKTKFTSIRVTKKFHEVFVDARKKLGLKSNEEYIKRLKDGELQPENKQNKQHVSDKKK